MAGITIRRWYDKDPSLSEAVLRMKALSDESRHVVGIIIERLCASKQSDNTKHSKEKTMGLLKSKHKRRWYDQDPVLHKAFNQLYLLEPQDQSELARYILGQVVVLEMFENACQRKGIPLPDLKQLTSVSQIFFAEGAEAAQAEMEKLVRQKGG